MDEPENLLAEHRLYDQYVDVVCAFEWLFTETREMPSTVRHFERFPKLTATDGNPATPDFTVLFNDGSAIVAEIARIALHENSVEGLCSQIMRYDDLNQIDGPTGSESVQAVDVLLLAPFDIATDMVRRVLDERLDDPEHSYSPAVRPCIVQFFPQSDRYYFQRRSEPSNGTLRDFDRSPGLGNYFSNDFKPPAGGFAPVKAARPFMNDPVAPLYLACQLWTKVFPLMADSVDAVGDYRPLVFTSQELANTVSVLYGSVEIGAVRRAMEILTATRASEMVSHDRWRVAFGSLSIKSGEEMANVLAHRTKKPPARGLIRRLKEAYDDLGLDDPLRVPRSEPGSLFE